VISVLRGENTEKVRDRGHVSLSTFAILKGCSRNELRDLIWQLIGQGFLEQTSDEFPILRLTQRSRAVLRNEEEVRLRQPIATKKQRSARLPASFDGPVDAALFQTLREWRRSEAGERGVPPYIIFSDRTLREIARAKPATLTQLREVYGVGDAKLEAFGSAVLAVLTASA
jgi:ATP-dependent DNA helicase RecQ